MTFTNLRDRTVRIYAGVFGALRKTVMSVIGRRLLLLIIGFSSVVTLGLTAVELSLVYTRDIGEIDKRLGQVEQTHIDSIAHDVWELNWAPLEQTMRGILNLPDIEYVRVVSDTGHQIQFGAMPTDEVVNRDFTLIHNAREIGRLQITATRLHVREHVIERIGVTLLNNGIKTFLVSLFALAVIRQLITRRLFRLSDYSQHIDLSRKDVDANAGVVELPRDPDELDQVEHALSDMVRRAQRAYHDLEQSEKRFRQLVESNLDAMVVLEIDRILFVNAAAIELFGAKDERELLGQDMCRFVEFDAHAGVREQLQQAIAGRHLQQVELRLLRADRSAFTAELSVVPIRFDNRDAAQVVLRDVTERKNTEARLRQSAAVFENSLEGVFITGADGTIMDANGALSEITGYSHAEIVGNNPRMWKSDRYHDDFFAELWQTLLYSDRWRGEIWNCRKGGEQFPSWLTVSAVRDAEDQLTHYVALLTDISLLKDTEARLVHLAHHDSLTDLPNRLLFNDRVHHAIARARRYDKLLSTLFIDLDNFKNINDSFGHPTGDKLLRLAAARLQLCVRRDSTVARIGGDEFTILLEDVDHRDDAALVADRILAAFVEPFQLEDRELFISPSIGISMYPRDGGDTDALLRNADAAMYKAKQQGRNGYAFYTSQLTTHVIEKVELEQRLRQALKFDELAIYYQPQIDLESGSLCGAEALLRWRYSQDEMIPPARFIPLAEETGLIIPIGDWMLEMACRQAVTWLAEGLPLDCMAVNISATQVNRTNFAGIVEQVLSDSGLEPQRLELEITEGSFIGQQRFLENDLRALRQIGVRVAIDDFGTGYSSMAQLKHLDVDRIKIDRSFVQDIPRDPYDCAIVTALTSMGQGLELEMIAEGIETEAQRRFLLEQGCRLGQGFLYSEPLSAPDFASWANQAAGHRTRLKSEAN